MKKFVAAVSLAVAAVAAQSAFAYAPIPLVSVGPDEWSGQFSGSGSTNYYTLDLTTIADPSVYEQLTANLTGGSGFDITNAWFDSTPLTPVLDLHSSGISTDFWTFGFAAMSPGIHQLRVDGISKDDGQFTGSLDIRAQHVPEPASYALVLAALAGLAVVGQRRTAKM